MPTPIIATTEMDNVCWTPSIKHVKTTKMYDFVHKMAAKYNSEPNYQALHKWSYEELSNFWGEVWNLAQIKSTQDFKRVVDNSSDMNGPTKWFEGSLLNYAENILERGDESATAIIQFGKHIALILR